MNDLRGTSPSINKDLTLRDAQPNSVSGKTTRHRAIPFFATRRGDTSRRRVQRTVGGVVFFLLLLLLRQRRERTGKLHTGRVVNTHTMRRPTTNLHLAPTLAVLLGASLEAPRQFVGQRRKELEAEHRFQREQRREKIGVDRPALDVALGHHRRRRCVVALCKRTHTLVVSQTTTAGAAAEHEPAQTCRQTCPVQSAWQRHCSCQSRPALRPCECDTSSSSRGLAAKSQRQHDICNKKQGAN